MRAWAQKLFVKLPKEGMTPVRLEHILVFLLGLVLVLAENTYFSISSIGKVIILILYLSSLVGIARIPMPAFKTKFRQVMFTGLASGVLDSYIVLEQCKNLRTAKPNQDREKITQQKNNQPIEGVRAQFLAILTIAALIGGLILWFGEVYAAGLYINDGRAGIASAFFILPPALIFLALLGLYAKYRLPLEVIPNKSIVFKKRDLIEFMFGIIILIIFHNPMLALGLLMIYAVVTRQDDHLLDIVRNHTEINVIFVLFVALIGGSWLVENFINQYGLNEGEILPVIPAALQSVLWGPLYKNNDVNFWMRITTLSTGALIFPTSSLVGVMLFKNLKQWKTYMKYSLTCAAIWYCIMWVWIKLFLNSPIGDFLEGWAHGGAH